MYHFAGANTPKYDAQTTTEGLEDDERRAPGAEKGGVLDERREESIGGPGGGQGDQDMGKRQDVGAHKPVSGEETVGCCEKSETEVQAQNLSCVVLLLGVPTFSVPGLPRQ